VKASPLRISEWEHVWLLLEVDSAPGVITVISTATVTDVRAGAERWEVILTIIHLRG
jgi:hypothetical protein